MGIFNYSTLKTIKTPTNLHQPLSSFQEMLDKPTPIETLGCLPLTFVSENFM